MKRQSRNIDWTNVKQRLNKAEQALDVALHEDAVYREATFARRAATLAHRSSRSGSDIGTDDRQTPVLIFQVSNEHYGLPLRAIVEVLSLSNCTMLPGGPAEVVGVMSIAGELRSVLSLRRLLDLESSSNAGQGFVLLVRVTHREIAFCVDGVENIAMVNAEQLTTFGDAPTSVARYASGRTSDGIPILNPTLLGRHPVLTESLQT